jgi:hypothetical protein
MGAFRALRRRVDGWYVFVNQDVSSVKLTLTPTDNLWLQVGDSAQFVMELLLISA